MSVIGILLAKIKLNANVGAASYDLDFTCLTVENIDYITRRNSHCVQRRAKQQPFVIPDAACRQIFSPGLVSIGNSNSNVFVIEQLNPFVHMVPRNFRDLYKTFLASVHPTCLH